MAANLLFGQLLIKIGAKNIITIGLIGGGISALLFGLTDNLVVFSIMIVLNFVFAGAYQAAAANTLLAQWFPKTKGIAFGWATMGIVLASVFWAPYITNAFALIGEKMVFIIVAIIFWALAVINIFFIKNTPEEAGSYPDGDPNASSDEIKQAAAAMMSYRSPFTIKRLLGSKQTWQLMFGWGLPWLAMMAIFSQLVPRLLSLGYEMSFSSLVLAISGLIALPASYLFGWLDTKLGCKKSSLILTVFLILGAISALLHGSGIFFVWATAVCMAMGQGAIANLVPSMIGTWFGRWDYASAARLQFPLVNIVATCGMTLVGVCLGKGFSYETIYYICIALLAVGFVIILTCREKMIGKEG